MTAKEVASKVHHCSNKETTERVIQAAMDSARDEALEQAASICDGLDTDGDNRQWDFGVEQAAINIRFLKTPKPAPASGPVTHGVDAPVDGVLSAARREELYNHIDSTPASDKHLDAIMASHTACERTLRDSRNLLREAEARGDEWKRVANEREGALREARRLGGILGLRLDTETYNREKAEQRITALEKALTPFTGRFKDYVGLEDEWDSHQSFTIGDCRKADEALAQQPPQATSKTDAIKVCSLCGSPAYFEENQGVWRHITEPGDAVICDKYGYPIDVIDKPPQAGGEDK